MKTYRRHNCERKHRTYSTVARCIWPHACWVDGEGPYATLAWCRVLTVQLHRTIAEARSAKRVIDSSACGGRCRGQRGHEIVMLAKLEEMRPWA